MKTCIGQFQYIMPFQANRETLPFLMLEGRIVRVLRNFGSFNFSVLHWFTDFFVSLKDSATSMSLNFKLIFRMTFLKQSLKLNSYSTANIRKNLLPHRTSFSPAVTTYCAISMKPLILLYIFFFPQSNYSMRHFRQTTLFPNNPYELIRPNIHARA